MRETLQIEISLATLLQYPTIAACASHVDEQQRARAGIELPPLTAQPRNVPLPLSFAQDRLWFVDRLGLSAAAYHVPLQFLLRGTLDVDVLRECFVQLMDRHEILRTRFESSGAATVQRIDAVGGFALPLADLRDLPAAERTERVQRWIEEERARPFDLSTGPLVRAVLLRLDEQEHVLLLTLHHIVTDGWSCEVMLHELGTLYAVRQNKEPAVLTRLPVQYADYALWQRKYLRGPVLDRLLQYWDSQLRDMQQMLLPTDRPRSAVQSFRGAVVTFRVPLELSHRLRALGRQHAATLFMVLLSAFKAMLWRWSGQNDIAIGSPIAGRTQQELQPLIGLFVNTLVLRTRVSGELSCVELLQGVKATVLGAYVHQELPLEKLVQELQPHRDLSHQPLFQVLFALHYLPMRRWEFEGLHLQPIPVLSQTAKFDLSLQMSETAGGALEGCFEYATDLFDAYTIRRLARRFERLLQQVVEHPQVPLQQLDQAECV